MMLRRVLFGELLDVVRVRVGEVESMLGVREFERSGGTETVSRRS